MWGLAVATVMTVFVIPLVYRAGMARGRKQRRYGAWEKTAPVWRVGENSAGMARSQRRKDSAG